MATLTTTVPRLQQLTPEALLDFENEYDSVTLAIPSLKMAPCLSIDIRDTLTYVYGVDFKTAEDDTILEALRAAVRPRDLSEATQVLLDLRIGHPTASAPIRAQVGRHVGRVRRAFTDVLRFKPLPPKPDPETGTDAQARAYEAGVKVKKALHKWAVKTFSSTLTDRYAYLRTKLEESRTLGLIPADDLDSFTDHAISLATEAEDFEEQARRFGYQFNRSSAPSSSTRPVPSHPAPTAPANSVPLAPTAPVSADKPKYNDFDRKQNTPPSFCRLCGVGVAGGSHWSNQCPRRATTALSAPIVQSQVPAAPARTNPVPRPVPSTIPAPANAPSVPATGPAPAPAATAARWTRLPDGRLQSNQVETPGPAPAVPCPAVVNQDTCLSILDTGSQVTCISRQLAQRLNLKMQPAPHDLAGAGGEAVSTEDLVHADLELSGLQFKPSVKQWPIYVLNTLTATEKLLIGCDLLTHLGYVTPAGLHIPFRAHQEEEEEEYAVVDHPILDVQHVGTTPDFDGVIAPEFPLQAEARALLLDYQDVLTPVVETAVLDPATITLIPNANLPYHKPRPLHPHVLAKVHRHFDELEAEGTVEEANGPCASRLVIVLKGSTDQPKEDRPIRPCGDYRDLNKVTVPDRFPLWDIKSFFYDIDPKAEWFFIVDIPRGFNNMPMDPDSRYLTALVMPGKFVQYRAAPFGLRNLPSQFQRAIAKVIKHVPNTRNFVDDIFGHDRSPQGLLHTLSMLFEILRAHRLHLRPEKCLLGGQDVKLLGYGVTPEGRYITEDRTASILALSSPQTPDEVRSLIGGIGFVCDFIDHGRVLMKPLQQAADSRDPQNFWGPAQHDALHKVLAEITSEKVLAHPDLSKPWILETDASNLGLGGVLWQVDADGRRRPVCFFSKTFSSTQQNWSTFDQELFALIFCLTRADIRPLFLAHTDLLVRTDHRNLLYLPTKEPQNKKHRRWILLLSEFTFRVEHIPGADNFIADYISRHSSDSASCNAVEVGPNVLHEQVKDLQRSATDDEKNSWSSLPRYACQNGVHYADDRLIIPQGGEEIKKVVFRDAHRYHSGRDPTVDAIQNRFKLTWPRLRPDVSTRISNCILCQKVRLQRFLTVPMGTTFRSRPFETIALDTIGPFPADSQHNRYVVVAIDMFSRLVELVPAPSNNALCVVHAVWTHIVSPWSTR